MANINDKFETSLKCDNRDVSLSFEASDSSLLVTGVFIKTGESYSASLTNNQLKVNGIKDLILNNLVQLSMTNNSLLVNLTVMTIELKPKELTDLDLLKHRVTLLLDKADEVKYEPHLECEELNIFSCLTDGYINLNPTNRTVVINKSFKPPIGMNIITLNANGVYCNGNTPAKGEIEIFNSKNKKMIQKIFIIRGNTNYWGSFSEIMMFPSDGGEYKFKMFVTNQNGHNLLISDGQGSFEVNCNTISIW